MNVISVELALSILIGSIIPFAILYFIIFHKYNKRNELKLGEIGNKLIGFVAYSMIILVVLLVGIDAFIEGILSIESKYERISYFIVSVIIISAAIIIYYYHIKRCLINIKKEEKEKIRKGTNKIGEYFLFLFICIMIFMPLINIPKDIAIYIYDKPKACVEVLKEIGYSAIAIFLLYTMNPLKIFDKSDSNDIKLNVNTESKNLVNDSDIEPTKEDLDFYQDLEKEVKEKIQNKKSKVDITNNENKKDTKKSDKHENKKVESSKKSNKTGKKKNGKGKNSKSKK